MTNSLSERLLARMNNGEAVVVRHATAEELAGFHAMQWKCHDNVRRWCELHSDHRRAMGWIISGDCVLDRHSVVDEGANGLVDITPLADRNETLFLPHDGDPSDFDNLPNQIIAVSLNHEDSPDDNPLLGPMGACDSDEDEFL